MTEKEARAATKYFGEGVKAEVWCYAGAGNWALLVVRSEGSAQWLDIDSLKRSALHLRRQLEEGRKDLEFRRLGLDGDDGVKFYTPAAAASCLREVYGALRYIQSVSSEDDWRDVSDAVFTTELPKASGAVDPDGGGSTE